MRDGGSSRGSSFGRFDVPDEYKSYHAWIGITTGVIDYTFNIKPTDCLVGFN